MTIALIALAGCAIIFLLLLACTLDRASSSEAMLRAEKAERDAAGKKHAERIAEMQKRIDNRNERIEKQNKTIDWLLDQIIDHPEHIGVVARAMRNYRKPGLGNAATFGDIVMAARALSTTSVCMPKGL